MVARFVRDEEAAGSNPVIPTTLNLSNQSVSEVFALFKILQKIDFDHNFLSSTVGQNLFSLFTLYQNLIHPKAMAQIFLSVPSVLLCIFEFCFLFCNFSFHFLYQSGELFFTFFSCRCIYVSCHSFAVCILW